MKEKIIAILFGAVAGGVTAAAVLLFAQKNTTFDTLEVKNLTITKQASVLNKDGKESLILKDGSLLANNTVFGKKFVGTQYQGRIIVANRMFTSPDDLNTTPLEQWRFLTEVGCSDKTGGEVIVRSLNGANVVGQPLTSGLFFRTGFDEREQPQLTVWSNADNRIAAQAAVQNSDDKNKKPQTAAKPPAPVK
ncbi:MAG: hypothetical protein LBN39_00820 [Planctomycetaceae bacterium]|jgi:hypothetical protein|nr:hypothetical protein [Planctomycetaceae bacterium]